MASARLTASTRADAAARPQRASARFPLAIAVGVLLVFGCGYLIARETSLFAVRSFEIRGAPADLERSLQTALARFEGQSLVGISLADVERAVDAVPAVRSATVDRDFPHALNIDVRPEQAVAIVRRDEDAWLVSASGRVLQRLEPGVLRPVPRVWIESASGEIALGDFLLPEQGAVAVHALAEVPADFPFEIESARGTEDDLVLVLAGKTEVRLGDAASIGEKLASAKAVLQSLTADERHGLSYVDVSLPARPVAAEKPQVETSA